MKIVHTITVIDSVILPLKIKKGHRMMAFFNMHSFILPRHVFGQKGFHGAVELEAILFVCKSMAFLGF